MTHTEKKLASREIFHGRILTLEVDRVELEDGSQSRREIVRHPGGAGILALDADESVSMIRQFRYAFGRELLEIPAGKLEPGEDPRQAAIRELEEECGLLAGNVRSLGCIYPSVGYDDEVIHLYLATDLQNTDARPDPGEFLTVERHPLSELVQMSLRGDLCDAKTVTAVLKTWMLFHGDRQTSV